MKKQNLALFLLIIVIITSSGQIVYKPSCENINKEEIKEKVTQHLASSIKVVDIKVGNKWVKKSKVHEFTQLIGQRLRSTYDAIETNEMKLESTLKENIGDQEKERIKKKIKYAKEEYCTSLESLKVAWNESKKYISKLVKDNKAPKYYENLVDELEGVYIFFTETVEEIRTYLTDPSFFKKRKEEVTSIIYYIDANLKILQGIILQFVNELPYPQVWQKDVNKQSLNKIFPDYAMFFKNYDKTLTALQGKMSSKEIFYYLFTKGGLRVEKRTEEQVAADFVERLKKFAFKLSKSWVVTKNDKKMIEDAKEIIEGLQEVFPIVLPSDTEKIGMVEDFPRAFILDVGTALFESLSKLKENIKYL